MVIPMGDQPVYGLKMSSVGPAKVTGSDVVHQPTPMDLAMKLHYLRGVYYFSAKAVEGLTIPRIKETMFTWFNDYNYTCGRFRRSDSGRPYIKCNDCGARFIEGKCDMTVDEWLETDDGSLVKLLASQHVIGPEIGFSPPFLIQVTHFKCGGIAMGFSWAHILGDAFSASHCFNQWAHLLSGLRPTFPSPTHRQAHKGSPEVGSGPISIEQVGAASDHWVCPGETPLETLTVHLTPPQISHLQSGVGLGDRENVPVFESICVALWQMIARIRGDDEPRVVTVCRDDESERRVYGSLSNSQRISVARAESSILGADPRGLLHVLMCRKGDENARIEEAVEKDNGVGDFVVYGANLTFVNLEGGDFYELKFNGHRPVFVNYALQSVGDQGVVLVLPGPEDDSGRVVTVILPEKQLVQLRGDLRKKVGSV